MFGKFCSASRRRLSIARLLAFTLVLGGWGASGLGQALADTSPGSGLFLSPIYSIDKLKLYQGIEYSTRPNDGGLQYTSDLTKKQEQGTAVLSIKMDVAVPPNATVAPAPAVVWIHGGGFSAGSKEDVRNQALSYARAGYIAVAINYRLTPDNNSSPDIRGKAIRQATEDAMNAIRFLKANANRYAFRLDPTRIAVFGSSAGGGITLINAVEYDTLAGTVSDHPGISSRAAAAVSTGATLLNPANPSNPAYPFSFDATDTPVQLFHANPTDRSTGATWTGAVLPTQAAINASGNICEVVAQPDMTHTVNLSLGGDWWGHLSPFLWTHLRLAELR